MILLSTTQLVSGIEQPILSSGIQWTNWVDTTWLHYVKEELDSIKGTILLQNDIYKPPRKGDRFIMNVFYEWNLSKLEMQKLNRCRIHLQIVTVSDLTNHEGKHILDQVINFEQTRHSIWQWPIQDRPTKTERDF